MAASRSIFITRRFTEALFADISRGAKNTPKTSRAKHCRANCSASSSLPSAPKSECGHSSA